MPRHKPDIWALLLVLGTAGPVVLGLSFMVLYSFGGIGLLSKGWTTEHWHRMLRDDETWVSLGYSVYIAIGSLLTATLLALAAVLALGSRLREGILGRSLYVPLAIPPMVAALLSYQLLGNAGLLSRVAYALSWVRSPTDFPALMSMPGGIGIILTQIGLVAPFLALLFERIARNEGLDELLRVAETLGGGRLQVIERVALPVLLRPALPALSVYMIVLLGSFEIPLMVGAPYPAMISVLIQRRFAQFDLGTKPEAYALASLYSLLLIGLLLVVLRLGRSNAPSKGVMW